jgi:hypothetical protein
MRSSIATDGSAAMADVGVPSINDRVEVEILRLMAAKVYAAHRPCARRSAVSWRY